MMSQIVCYNLEARVRLDWASAQRPHQRTKSRLAFVLSKLVGSLKLGRKYKIVPDARCLLLGKEEKSKTRIMYIRLESQVFLLSYSLNQGWGKGGSTQESLPE